MPRRRHSAKPWVRPSLSAIALLGTLLTGYLTVLKLTGGSALCPTAGCTAVLTSAYAEVFGLPLALFGCGAYALVGLSAGLPPLLRGDQPEGLESDWEQRTWMPLFLLATAMVGLSGYLVYLLVVELQSFCLFCVASALLSLGLWVILLVGHRWEDTGGLWFNGALMTLAVLVFSTFLGGPGLARSAPPQGGVVITQPSSPAAIALAQHLSDSGAVMYGAYWCPHCQDQKKLFGQAGAKAIPYVECDASGENPQPEKCRAAGIDGFPTWVIGGQMLSGTQDLADLAEASGYLGSRAF